MQTIHIGIDPGASGGICILAPNGEIIAKKWTGESDAVALLAYATRYPFPLQCWIEQVHAMPGQGVTSMFSFGRNFGFWTGAVMALKIPLRTVTPQLWQKGIPGRAGKKGAELKRYLKNEASRRFPHIKVTLATADALLIADWGKSCSPQPT
jgi:hypothetical protein